MDKNFIKIGEILIIPPFDEEKVLQPLWDKGFKTCVVDPPEGYLKWIIMKEIQ